jgi:hypothetical protein
MVYRRRRILLSEIERQCAHALIAYDDAAAALQKHDADRFWYCLQALTTAAGQLAGVLWPVPNGSTGWAAELREALAVNDESPLHHPGLAAALKIVSQLENWQAGHPERTWQASNFGPSGFLAVRSKDCIRYFDRETSVYIFCGQIFELPHLLAAIAELGHRARMEIEHLRELV